MNTTGSEQLKKLGGGALVMAIMAAGFLFGKSHWQSNAELNQVRKDMDASMRRSVADFPRQYRARLEDRKASLLKELQSPDAARRAEAARQLPEALRSLSMYLGTGPYPYPPTELVTALGDNDPQVRANAASAFWSLRPIQDKVAFAKLDELAAIQWYSTTSDADMKLAGRLLAQLGR